MWPFSSKKDKDKKSSKEMTSEEVRAQALAQFRKTESELGRETIEEMQRALEYEAAKKKIEDAVDDKGSEHSAEDVLDQLKILMDEDKRGT